MSRFLSGKTALAPYLAQIQYMSMCGCSFCLPMSLHRFFKDVHTNGATSVTTANALTCYLTRDAVLGSGTVDATDIKISAFQTAKRQAFSCRTDKSLCLCIIV